MDNSSIYDSTANKIDPYFDSEGLSPGKDGKGHHLKISNNSMSLDIDPNSRQAKYLQK